MCPDLDDIPNGAVMMTGNSVDDTATYTCDMGYELVGVMTVTCQSNGMWDNPPPVCRRKLTSQHAPWEGRILYTFSPLSIALCPDLTDPANGAVMMTGNSVDDTATYTCDMGYELVGVMTVTCQSNGMWDNPPPVCRRKLTSQHAPWEGRILYTFSPLSIALCPDLTDPANGAVMMTGNSVDDTATYTCDIGYELVGVMTVTCQSDRMWDNPPPVCRRKLTSQHAPWEGRILYTFSPLSIALCPDLTDPANGAVMMTGNSVDDTATYTCDIGYELVGVMMVTCQGDGTWDNPPICRSIEGRRFHNIVVPSQSDCYYI